MLLPPVAKSEALQWLYFYFVLLLLCWTMIKQLECTLIVWELPPRNKEMFVYTKRKRCCCFYNRLNTKIGITTVEMRCRNFISTLNSTLLSSHSPFCDLSHTLFITALIYDISYSLILTSNCNLSLFLTNFTIQTFTIPFI